MIAEDVRTPRQLLKAVFGHDDFRPGQAQVVDTLLAGRSALAVFPTGGGKSLCYQLPALVLDGLTVVVSPLIALMKDQVDALKRLNVAAARLDSSVPYPEVKAIQEAMEDGSLKLLYVAPERLSNERFVGRLRRTRISLLAVDEAHCISSWGHNFRPDYLKLARAARELKVGRVLALTATATPDVSSDIRREFAIAPADHVQTGFFRPNLDLSVSPCAPGKRVAVLLERLRGTAGPTIVYVTLQRTAEAVAGELARAGVSAVAYHAGLEDELRGKIQDDFMRDRVRVVVATIAFGMGIDKADIRAVYHLDLPKTLEGYAQEVGRAGRDGLPSRCELIASRDDQVVLSGFVHGDTPTPEALRGLVDDVLGRAEAGGVFDVSTYDLSQAFDLRPLVVSTALTHLELEGVIAHTAPFYTGYKLKLLRPLDEVVARFDPGRQKFLRSVLAQAKAGRTWLTLDPAVAAHAIGETRERIVAAIGYLEEQGDLETEVTGLRHGYRLLRPDATRDELVAMFGRVFEERAARDLERIEGVARWAEAPGCLARRLVGYFGEELGRDCGRCARCRGEPARPLPREPRPPVGDAERALVAELRAERHAALAHPRQMARFLAGLSSPATQKARLSRDPRYGRLEQVPFEELLALAEGVASRA